MFRWKNKNLKDLDSKRVKKNIPAYIVLGLAIGAMTFFGICEPPAGQIDSLTGVAGSVAGQDISPIQFRRAHIQQRQQYQQQFKENFDPVKMRLSERVLNQLIDQLVLYDAAKSNGIYVPDSAVEKVVLEAPYFRDEQGRFSAQNFERYLRNQGYTEKSFTEDIRRDLTSNRLRSFVTQTYANSERAVELDYKLSETKLNVDFIKVDNQAVKVEVSEDELTKFTASEEGQAQVKAYYEGNKSEFNKDKRVRARHILIAFEGARRATGDAAKRSKEDARKKAEEVLAEAKASPGKFADLAKTYTDEPSGKAKGGDLGFFKKEAMVKEFSDVAFAMQKGQVSDIVESPFGFHVIKVEEVEEAKNTSLEAATPAIARELLETQKKPELIKERAANALELAKAGKVGELENLGLKWKATGEFALNSRFIPGGLGSNEDVKKAVFSMKKPGDVYPELVAVNNANYVLRLKSRKDADLSQLTDEKREELAESQKFLQAFWLFNNLTASIKSRYEDKGLISRNPEFLEYDKRLQGN